MAQSAFSGLNLDEKKAKRALVLQVAGTPNGEESAALRIRFRVPDDDVIKRFDLENFFGCVAQHTGYLDIRGTGSGIA